MSHFAQPKLVGNWIMTELMRELKGEENGITACPIKPAQLAALLKAVDDGTISGKIAKTVFEEMYATGKDAAEIIKAKGLKQVSDTGELTQAVAGVLDKNPDEVAKYLGGKTSLISFFVGQVMKATRGKANPKAVNEILVVELEKRR